MVVALQTPLIDSINLVYISAVLCYFSSRLIVDYFSQIIEELLLNRECKQVNQFLPIG